MLIAPIYHLSFAIRWLWLAVVIRDFPTISWLMPIVFIATREGRETLKACKFECKFNTSSWLTENNRAIKPKPKNKAKQAKRKRLTFENWAANWKSRREASTKVKKWVKVAAQNGNWMQLAMRETTYSVVDQRPANYYLITFPSVHCTSIQMHMMTTPTTTCKICKEKSKKLDSILWRKWNCECNFHEA